jgi:tetratricopeptide (TPR) repeat protein
MATSEIDKLERRYAENPQGLTFAPLAEVHRKNGDVGRALELLRIGLELHPNYIPASIVLGRCHQDQGDPAAAEAAFAHVLRLDDENVIALKSLADITERSGRFTEAEQWLQRLVVVDRSNEEAHDQLRRIQEAKAAGALQAVPAASETPVHVAEVAAPAADPEPAEKPLELTEELSPEPATVSAEPPLPTPREPENESRADERPSPEPVVASETPRDESAETVQPVSGLMTQEFQPPTEPVESQDIETQDDVVLHSSVLSEFHVPDASEDLKASAGGTEREPPVPEPYREESLEPERVVVEAREPEPIVTETMAEVLLQQGYASDALRIYRELARRSPQDNSLQSRIVEAERTAEGLSAPKPSYSARETQGRSVQEFFQTLLAAHPLREGGWTGSASAGTGASSTSSKEPGAESGFTEEAMPVPPAVPGAPQRTEAGVSFDAFFSAPADSHASLQQNPPEPGSDDLDQFQSWLQNLKR